MLKLNVNEEKQLTFEVQIGGVQSEQVESRLRIEIDNVEYGFPADVGRESITVNLPPLRSITARKLKEGKEAAVKLEIIADGNYLVPWQDTFRLSNPVVIEAKIVDDDFNEPSVFKTKLVTEGNAGDQKQGIRLEKVEAKSTDDEDILTERIVNKLAEKLAGKKLTEKDEAEEIEADEIEADAEVDAKVDAKVDAEKVEEELHTEKVSPKELLNITKEGVYAYMERAGTANPQIQDIIYEQAETAAKSSKPLYVLKQVVKILKNKK